ncbi:hypothetical protein GCM10020295_12050 [Streptomyces cinereospinus]
MGRAALALKGLDPADPALDAQDFGSWLTAHGQSRRAVEALWDLVGVATLNAVAGDASLGLAATVFKTGLLSEPGAADIGWARVPLGDLHDRLARGALDSAGVRTRVRTRVASLSRTDDGRWRVQVPGEVVDTDAVVLAVPQREAHDLLPQGALDDPGRLLRIGTAPILNIHVVYDRAVVDVPFLTALGTPVQWVFDRTEASGLRTGQYLALSQSAAQDEIDAPVAVLRGRYLPELERLLPRTRGAGVRDFFVTRERTATFAPAPGVGRLRPGARTKASGLYLAGAWTATGWPATMESAVRSGIGAADAALRALGGPAPAISSTSRRRREDRAARGGAPAPPAPQQEERLCPLCPRPRRPLERPRWTWPRSWSAAGPWPHRCCGRPSTASRLPWTRSPRTTSAGSTPPATPPTATAARPCAPPSPCCPPRSPEPRRRPACPARSPSNWSTTSPCCTMT